MPIAILGSPLRRDFLRRTIVQSNFRNTSPSYALAHVDVFNHALEKSSSIGGGFNLDPVLQSNIPASSDRTTSVLCHTERNGLWFLCPISVEGVLASFGYLTIVFDRLPVVDPLFAFSFIDTFIQTLVEYLGDVSSSLIRDHFDIVYQVPVRF